MDLVENILKTIDGIFIQVFDCKKKNWLTVCPVTSIMKDTIAVLYSDAHMEALADHLRRREILYVLSSIQSRKVG